MFHFLDHYIVKIWGVDTTAGEPRLMWLDALGALQDVPFGAHGLAARFALGLLDNGYREGMSLEEARELMEACFMELEKRYLISKKYDMKEEPSASGGLSCLWKIYDATEKASGAPVSVHVFKKEDLKDLDKALREQVLDILRREMKTLASVSSRSHPSVIRHIESFEENRSILAFVTERLSCSLANAIAEGYGGLNPQTASALRRGFEQYEIARGFYGLVEALQFVHTIKRRVHLNIAPESIFLSSTGQFKLGGFGFSVDLPSDGSSTTPCPYFQTGARTGFEGVWRLHPVMAYSSPEATAPAGSSDVSCASDMFSLGCLMYQFCRDKPNGTRLVTCDPTPQAHQTFCATLDFPGRLNVSVLFSEVQSLISSLLQTNPSARPQLATVTINPFFHGNEVTVLKTIDGIPGRNPAEAATFLTSIRTAVTKFPMRVQRDCIMHALLDACAADESERLWGSALPIIADVCQRLDRKEIIAGVQDKFKPALKAKPLEALLPLVEAMPIYLGKMEVGFFRSDVVPMVCRALQFQAPEGAGSTDSARKAVEVHEAALKAVTEEAFHRAIDGRTRELDILPRICWLVVKTATLRVKVNALLCLSKTFQFYQVRAVVDKILPTLKFAAERDQTVAIQLCVLGCYEAVSKRLERLGPVATHILPACTPMLACQGLNSTQFEMVVGIVRGMLQAVIEYRNEDIANPKSSNVNIKPPTHPGGVPNQEEIEKARVQALGGWKPASTGPSQARPDSKLEAASTVILGNSRPGREMTPVATPSTQSVFDISDMSDLGLSLPSTPSSTGSLRPATSQRYGLGGTLGTNPSGLPAAATGTKAGSSPSSGPFTGLGPAPDVFKNLSTPQLADGYQGSADPFGGAGFGGGITGTGAAASGNNAGGNVGDLSWMDDMFAGTTNTTVPAMSATDGKKTFDRSTGRSGVGAGGNRQTSPPPSGSSDMSWMGAGGAGVLRNAPSPKMNIQPPPVRGGSDSSVADPFGALISSSTPGSARAPAPTSTSTARGTFPQTSMQEGGFGAGLSQGAAIMGAGVPQGAGMGATGSLEDQLAKTQREIAQLTRELGAGATGMSPMTPTAGSAGGVGGLGTFGGFGAGNALGSLGNTTGIGGATGSGHTSFGSIPTVQSQGVVHDPFAFLDSGSQANSQGSNGRGGAPSDFDFLGRH